MIVEAMAVPDARAIMIALGLLIGAFLVGLVLNAFFGH